MTPSESKNHADSGKFIQENAEEFYIHNIAHVFYSML